MPAGAPSRKVPSGRVDTELTVEPLVGSSTATNAFSTGRPEGDTTWPVKAGRAASATGARVTGPATDDGVGRLEGGLVDVVLRRVGAVLVAELELVDTGLDRQRHHAVVDALRGDEGEESVGLLRIGVDVAVDHVASRVGERAGDGHGRGVRRRREADGDGGECGRTCDASRHEARQRAPTNRCHLVPPGT